MSDRTIHHGRNIKRIREIQGIKQEALAIELGNDWNQKKISLLESKEVVDDEILGEVAKALKVPVDAIKNFDEQTAVNFVANTFTDNATFYGYNYYPTFNPLEKLIQAYEENKKLYERLLQTEREKLELLERMLNERK
jgi:transcriptional regulator with XRE-family HTH domain